MNIYAKHIHDFLLEVIKKEIDQKKAIRQREEDKSKAEIQRLEEILINLKNFENFHYKELYSIYPDYPHHDWGYLSCAYNDIYNLLEFYKDPERCFGQYSSQVSKEESKYFYGSLDSALISYDDFHKASNLNPQSIKKYLKEMVDMNLIEQIRVIGGYEYRILGVKNE